MTDVGTISEAAGTYTIDAFGGDPGRAGRFDLGRDVRGLIDIKPENVLMVKMTFWLTP